MKSNGKEHLTAAGSANPLATSDQTEVTARALRILQTPEVKAGREKAEILWKFVLKHHPPTEAMASFDSMMDDYTFNYVLKAANLDANFPKVVHVYTPPHEWQEMSVPGSRWGGDNPDNIYRIIPIDAKANYRLDGRQFGSGPANVSYMLVSNWETSKTLNGIDGRDFPVAADGTFSITIGPDSANGRPNHIQTKPGALFLFIRDSLADWDEKANALTINRLDAPDGPPMTEQDMAERAAQAIVDGQPLVYYYIQSTHGKLNQMPAFFRAGPVGGLVSQRNSNTWALIEDEEALVITLDPSAAAYYSLVSQNYWFITIDYANHLSTLNNGQVTHNTDGTVTYVVSISDPGVHNWIDTAGIHNPILQIRLQGLPPELPREPWVKSQLIKLNDLKSVVPKETVWVSPEERAAQIAKRRGQIQARMADH